MEHKKGKKGQIGTTLTWFPAFLIIFFILFMFLFFTGVFTASKSVFSKDSLLLVSENGTGKGFREMNSFLYSEVVYNEQKTDVYSFLRAEKKNEFKGISGLKGYLNSFFGENVCYVICLTGTSKENPLSTVGAFSRGCNRDELYDSGIREVCNRLLKNIANNGFNYAYLNNEDGIKINFLSGGNAE
ncbi:MAG: hypothetical protein WCK90_05500 [archaeon]